MQAFVDFMSSPIGRIARIVVGVLLVLVGINNFSSNAVVGIIVALVGLVPIYAGAMNVCFIAPILGGKK